MQIISKFIIFSFLTLFSFVMVAPVQATGPQLQIDVTNSSAPIPEPDPSSTGEIKWITGQISEVGDGEDAVVEIDYDLRLFKELTVNGKLLTTNTEYTLEEGSTVITLGGAYLKTLSAGTYTLTAHYADGASFSTNFLITKDSEEAALAARLGVPDTGINLQLGKIATTVGNSLPYIIGFAALIVVIAIITFSLKTYLATRQRLRKCSRQHRGFTHQARVAKNTITALRGRPVNFSLPSQRIVPILAGAVILAGGITFGVSSLGLFSNANPTIAASNREESLTVLIDSDRIVETADLKDGSQFITVSQDVTVQESTGYGYNLYISTSSKDYSDLSINGSTSAEERISATDGTRDKPVALSADTYGYAVGTNNNKWSGVPVLGSEDKIVSKDSSTGANDTTTVYYGFNVTNNLPDGSYWGSDNHTIMYTAISNAAPPNIITYNCNGGSGSDTQSKDVGTEILLGDGSACSKDGYQIIKWNTRADGSGTDYDLGATYTNDIDITLYAIYDPVEHDTERNFTLNYNPNGGSGVPATQSGSNTGASYTFTISSNKPTRDGYAFQGWNTNKGATTATYQPGDSITVTNTNTTLYAIWKSTAPTKIKVSGINISGANSINLNSSSPKAALTATVSPSNATNKSITWQSSNNKVATVSSTGVVTGVEAGTATITAQANDGSGVKATYKVTVKKKVLILLGASQIARIAGSNYANIQEYTDTSSGNKYTIDQSTLNFVYKSGTGFAFQTGPGWDKVTSIVDQYSKVKDQVEFYIYFTLSGNDIKLYDCADIKSSNPDFKNQSSTYNSKIAALKSSGYNVNGYVTSMHPLKAGQAVSKYIVYNSDPNKCTAKYRSNYKYYTFNTTMQNYIKSAKYSAINYIDTFGDLVDTSNSNPTKWSYRSDWSSYSTSDGIHWNNATAKKYFNHWLNKNSAL